MQLANAWHCTNRCLTSGARTGTGETSLCSKHGLDRGLGPWCGCAEFLPVQVPTATTREAQPLVSGWPTAQRVMGQTVHPDQGSLNINPCVSSISVRHVHGLLEASHASVSCRPRSGSGAPPEAAQQHLSPRAVMLSLPSVRARVCTPRFALGAQRPTTYLPPTGYPTSHPPPSPSPPA